ncbi:hypothetical protein [Lacinutrix jangbogonensis]|uniref:hypothetical protein n=1 Tax=Lacinutrix jangbogonensis TaxID=1469557 RepID=UPI00053F20FF|nr:hypothetical protein [Lacinutrix jangbogonensis]
MKKLLFVYNADSGIGNTILDVAHKIFSPKTYNCNLCAITFDTLSENNHWKDFRKSSPVNMDFLHSDEFEKLYPNSKYEYPIILSKTEDNLSILISSKKIKAIPSSEALISEIKNRID